MDDYISMFDLVQVMIQKRTLVLDTLVPHSR
ncbi:MAG: hypothetical protein JWO09_1867 [Bacteroidetes bacterium]|nr:hypothetical protein [Bacteroidota bacterium]